jgi:hypothetical protein
MGMFLCTIHIFVEGHCSIKDISLRAFTGVFSDGKLNEKLIYLRQPLKCHSGESRNPETVDITGLAHLRE